MREILFRGKRIDNGAWVYGSFLLDGEAHRPLEKKHLSFSKCYIIPETDRDNIKTRFNDGSYYLQTVGYHVIPETVGQFTGLTDKNGKKIFEGDLLNGFQYPFYRRNSAEHNYFAEVIWFTGNCAFGLCTHKHPTAKVRGISAGNADFIEDFDSDDWEVIGNIHDNPELLKGGAEDGK